MKNSRLRFRAWDKRNKEFIEDWQDSDWVGYEGFDGGDSFTVLQCTGLKDKNGVDICEGHIVRLDEAGRGYDIALVSFGSCRFYLSSVSSGIEDWDMEVIGNIYENGELLNEQ